MEQQSTIQWYPGHMAKAKRLVQQNLKLVDVVIELLDARIPISSRNPMIDKILGSKPRLVVLNKADLADPEITEQWEEALKEKHIITVAVDSVKGRGFAEIPKAAKRLVAEKMAEMAAAGRRPRAVRCMVLGIPNVGKSSFINRLSRRRSAKTGDTPGVTKGKQMIKINKDMELLDTPGILWPKFEDAEVGLKLAATGAIKEQVVNVEEVALYLLKILTKIKPENLTARYKLSDIGEDSFQLLQQIGARRGMLLSGGVVDTHKAAVLVLKEFRAGKLGRISLERPGEEGIN
ncbi:ribosome biogenesis GTPase A [Desulfohalotomaculum tongense]|uniref:ribosome biogenesis GTPase YlqF n=1 Tax=Desulforadius tongensis TaxID=1216062 RepID=UPI00195AFC52|nr:ribosome biogenesis GTPase A [Desulforadius tongensis]